MSEAYKCDRCGKLYEEYGGKTLIKSGNTYNQVGFSKRNALRCEWKDLCPDCMDKLIEFMKEPDYGES